MTAANPAGLPLNEESLRRILSETVAEAMAGTVSEAIAEAVTEAVTEAMDQATTACACDIGPDSAAQMGHLMGMVRDLGNGDTARGVEAMRDSLRFVPRLMRLRDKVGTWVLSIVVAGATGGVLTLIWQGLALRVGDGK